jgi:hypothetical protein
MTRLAVARSGAVAPGKGGARLRMQVAYGMTLEHVEMLFSPTRCHVAVFASLFVSQGHQWIDS